MKHTVKICARSFKSRRWLLMFIIACIASVNILLLLFQTPAAHTSRVQGLSVSPGGSLMIDIQGLLAPAGAPINDLSKHPIVNNGKVKYLINPKDLCFRGPIELLVAVSSHAMNLERRKRTRESFNVGPQRDAKLRLVFFVSVYTHLEGFQHKIQTESDRYGDIVQIKAVESYKNLTLKSIAILYWSSRHCAQARYILKQDDDVKVDTFNVIRALRQRSMKFDHFIVGNSKLLVESPIRDELSKYYTSKEDFADSYYPIFVHGPGYAFPRATGALLYQASLRTSYFWLEDVYITGLCAAKAGVPVFFDSQFVLHEQWGNEM
ncbi:beta-1,3-galactosyltransferase 1-like [Elysia marginata]|uniref:Hexosyltransferase n=1 Tax=Elysia marginata TaxID=1093978 RepID=A0AAV4GMF4_9GAST|nr:beta-1,3-galactosyltransferase 1-like [Elysia marginata]